MNIFESIFLGLIQGLTEFLPVSSSGHLALFSSLFESSDEDLLFELLLHLGTLLAVFIVFFKKIKHLTLGVLKLDSEAIHYFLMVIVASVPTALIGLTFEKKVAFMGTQPLVVCTLLFLMGFFLFSTKWTKTEEESLYIKDDLNWWKALLLGVIQGVAILPGVSRSGSTIALSMWMGVSRKTAGEFSFLMSIPVIGGAALLKIKDAIELGNLSESMTLSPLVGVFVAFISGLISLIYLMKFIQKGKLYHFAFYLWPLSILGFIYFYI